MGFESFPKLPFENCRRYEKIVRIKVVAYKLYYNFCSEHFSINQRCAKLLNENYQKVFQSLITLSKSCSLMTGAKIQLLLSSSHRVIPATPTANLGESALVPHSNSFFRIYIQETKYIEIIKCHTSTYRL